MSYDSLSLKGLQDTLLMLVTHSCRMVELEFHLSRLEELGRGEGAHDELTPTGTWQSFAPVVAESITIA